MLVIALIAASLAGAVASAAGWAFFGMSLGAAFTLYVLASLLGVSLFAAALLLRPDLHDA
ncbi:hypothetical protein LR948_03005 [Roseivivax sp. GX 12232]|uniref:hypothetical protein n=1 Tax=Roseivivax sp. GX 12232 TaxID=2900547 RepID=UPI001E420EB8|nr:hypothetical protein [Roseivivax sp. GX 12232]MCE0504311.1 hypothetical protein [Roseivivax sp. GX 12232]